MNWSLNDLYNNLEGVEHELKGVSNSSSQNIAFLSTEIKGSTLKQNEIICSFFAQQASMPTTHDDKDLLQIDEDAMEEIDIRWQVAMITARIRKFMRKTGRPIDLKPKNGITFDKSKIECFNCQKLGHFARECRFAKYQENRANGRKEKKIVAIEDSNSKALVATDNNEEIDWTKEFDVEPVTFAMMALTELEEDDWSMEIDAEPVHFGQDGLGDFDWSNKADDTPVSLALMATNSEGPSFLTNGPSIPTNPSPKKVVKRETEETTDKEHTNFQGSTAQTPPPVILISIPEPDVLKNLLTTTPISESNIPKNLRFDISFADALLLMPRFAPTIKSLLMNKEKLLELAKIPLNENCSAMLLKKLPEKLGDPASFLFHLSLPELTPTRMTLELADRSITYPKGLAEDVFVKVGKFHFPTDFVVVDFEADPRVPLILGRSFLRTGRALIDVYGEEITIRVDNEAVTFNLDQTTRYSSTNDKSVNRIDIIDAVCEEYAPELLGFSNSSGGNPTPTSEPFTSEFILEEIEAYLKDDSISPEIDHADCDPEEDICLIEKLLNNDPFQLPPMDLKQSEVTEAKSSIEEPPDWNRLTGFFFITSRSFLSSRG
ncbi:reverse transcriptase domain-containing protein [Tanacetum coccineum]